jgi:prefoldin subunit 5
LPSPRAFPACLLSLRVESPFLRVDCPCVHRPVRCIPAACSEGIVCSILTFRFTIISTSNRTTANMSSPATDTKISPSSSSPLEDGATGTGPSAPAQVKIGDVEQEEQEPEAEAAVVVANLTLEDIVDRRSDRGIPIAKFVDDVQLFSDAFEPVPATAELMIGAYNQLHAKYRQYEAAFRQKMARLQDKIPELEKSIALIRHLQKQQDKTTASSSVCTVRYSLADNVYGRAQVDANDGVVHLWLGANVMLEYTYQDALNFLETNRSTAARDVLQLRDDLGLVRDQIVTCEVTMSRIYNWDVRRRREQPAGAGPAGAEAATTAAT